MPVLVLLLLGLLSNSALADTTETQRSDSGQQDLQRAGTQAAQHWGLTEQEWSRFEEIRRGPRGYWSPSLDPLTALGVEARDDAERQRYAELQVRLEAARAERELAYQRAYDEAWQRLSPACCRSRAPRRLCTAPLPTGWPCSSDVTALLPRAGPPTAGQRHRLRSVPGRQPER